MIVRIRSRGRRVGGMRLTEAQADGRRIDIDPTNPNRIYFAGNIPGRMGFVEVLPQWGPQANRLWAKSVMDLAHSQRDLPTVHDQTAGVHRGAQRRGSVAPSQRSAFQSSRASWRATCQPFRRLAPSFRGRRGLRRFRYSAYRQSRPKCSWVCRMKRRWPLSGKAATTADTVDRL